MFDQQNRQLQFIPDPADHFHQFVRFLRVHARRRLVEQQQLGLGRQRPGDFQPALFAVRQVPGDFIAPVVEFEHLQAFQRLGFDLVLFRIIPADAQHRFRHAVFHVEMIGDLDIVQDRQVGEQPDVLEGPGDAPLRDLVGFETDQAFAVELHLARCRFIDAGHQVESGGLAGAVRADQADQLALVDFHIEVGDRFQTAELFGQLIDF